MTTTDDYARDLAARALGRQRVREAMLRMHIKNNYRTHPPVFDPRCATCLRIIHGESATAGNTNGKAIEKGEPKMKSSTLRNLKTAFHILTTAQTIVALLAGAVPAKYAAIGAAVTATISFALNVLTRLYPWLGTKDESDDPKAV